MGLAGKYRPASLLSLIYGGLTHCAAAAAAWGSEWRLPTPDEFLDLLDGSYTTIEFVNTGTKGIRVKGNTTGYTDKSIFLPVAGGGKESTLFNADDGYY